MKMLSSADIYNKLIGFIDEIKIDIFIILLTLVLFIPFIFLNKPFRVGDGSEYYALSLAWKNTPGPFMADSSWLKYQELVESNQITGLVNAEIVKANFVKDIFTGVPADSHHFWFYSFCAAVIAELGYSIGVNIPIHVSFLLVHFTFLSILFVISWRSYKWNGLLAILLLTALSPIVWYIDKVHTEFFTYCVTTSAVILFSRKNNISAAFFLALASTQNISFAGISILLVIFDFFSRKKCLYSRNEAIVLLLTALFIGLHPAYYWFRYGYVDPKIAGLGGTIIYGNIRYFYVWFFDPDIGLFTNWPFGVLLLVLSLASLLHNIRVNSGINRWVVFYTSYILVSISAQSSTLNLNSGGTPGIGRYGLWYLALFFPIVIFLITKTVISNGWKIGFFAIIIFGISYSIYFFNPALPENYTKPSLVSSWIQKYLPGAYNPAPEIFAERYGGRGEGPKLWQALAVAGPDCHKLLIIN